MGDAPYLFNFIASRSLFFCKVYQSENKTEELRAYNNSIYEK